MKRDIPLSAATFFHVSGITHHVAFSPFTTSWMALSCLQQNNKPMRNNLPSLVLVLVACAFAAGCANTEKKFGRGFNNAFEIVRGGEFRRTMEQTAMFDSPDTAYSTGFFRGINRSLARTG